MNGTSLLSRNEEAIVIFTYGKYFRRNKDGSGSTGNWVIDESRKCGKVVIYKRTNSHNDIYIAKRAAVEPSKEDGRYVIKLAEIRYFGTTYFNWPQFTGSRNPVRYLRMKRRKSSSRKSSMNGETGINLTLALAE